VDSTKNINLFILKLIRPIELGEVLNIFFYRLLVVIILLIGRFEFKFFQINLINLNLQSFLSSFYFYN